MIVACRTRQIESLVLFFSKIILFPDTFQIQSFEIVGGVKYQIVLKVS